MQSTRMKYLLGGGLALMIAACGGGADESPVLNPAPSSGVAVDGYLRSATATCDANGDGLVTTGEVSVTTNAVGVYTFPAGCNAGVIVTGGIDIDTNTEFKGVLRAPVGATAATPLTTLIVAGATPSQLKSSLGLDGSLDLHLLDPAAKNTAGNLVNMDAMKKSLAVQQLTQKVTEVFAGLASGTGSATLQPIYREVTSAFAASLASKTLMVNAGSMDMAVVKDLVKAATEKVAQSTTVTSAVKSAAATLNADTLAQVISGGLKVQVEAILGATESKLKDETKKQQADETISAFVVLKKSQLTAAPSTATAVMGENLGNAVKDATSTAPPSNYLALVEDAISLVASNVTTKYTKSAFTSDAGISVKWPVSSTAVIKFTFNETGTFVWADGQTVSAALKISETGGGLGQVVAYIDKVGVKKGASGMEFLVPSDATATVYGVSTDGKKKAVIDFSPGVRGVKNTLSTSLPNNVLLGDVINYTINNVSNDFTNITALRGKYKVSLVVSNMPLRQVDGTKFTTVGIDVPVKLGAGGVTTETKSVVGAGLEGYITLTD